MQTGYVFESLLIMIVCAIIGLFLLFYYLANKNGIIEEFIEHNQIYKIGRIMKWLHRHDWIILIPYILNLFVPIVWLIMIIGFLIEEAAI